MKAAPVFGKRAGICRPEILRPKQERDEKTVSDRTNFFLTFPDRSDYNINSIYGRKSRVDRAGQAPHFFRNKAAKKTEKQEGCFVRYRAVLRRKGKTRSNRSAKAEVCSAEQVIGGDAEIVRNGHEIIHAGKCFFFQPLVKISSRESHFLADFPVIGIPLPL